MALSPKELAEKRRLIERVASLKDKVMSLEDELNQATLQLDQLFDGQYSGRNNNNNNNNQDSDDMLRELETITKENEALRSQVAAWQEKYENVRRQTWGVKKQNQELQRALKSRQ